MSTISHVSCRACKGAVGYTDVKRVVRCTYCGARLLVESDSYVPEYYFKHNVEEENARRALQRFLTQKEMPKGMLRHSRFQSAMLCYVPYHDVRFRRLGTMELNTSQYSPRSSKVMTTHVFGSTGYGINDWETTDYPSTQKQVARETKVVVGDIHRLEPAVRLPHYALEHTSIHWLLKEAKAELFPFSREKQGEQGRIVHPTVDPQQLMNNLDAKGVVQSVEDSTQYVERRARRIYYPLWRIRYRFAGRLYSAVVDGVSGELISARAPQGDTRRVMTLLGVTLFFAFLFGKLFKSKVVADLLIFALLSASATAETGALALSILLGMIGGAAMLAYGGWYQFRYPGEVVKTGETINIEKYWGTWNPQNSVLIRGLNRMVKWIESRRSGGI